MIIKHRDISIIKIDNSFITVASDSCGGVGLLANDTVKIDGFNVGYHTTIVSLAETFAIGAKPILITNTLSVSLKDYGKSILAGIQAAAKEAGLLSSNSITGSSEENFIVKSTGVGVTVIGKLPSSDFLPSPSQHMYEALVIGYPFYGNDVLSNKNALLSLHTVQMLKKDSHVLDLIPVGSKGILHEANQIADTIKMKFIEKSSNPEIMHISAGPATCAVAAVNSGSFEYIKELVNIPVIQIGVFSK